MQFNEEKNNTHNNLMQSKKTDKTKQYPIMEIWKEKLALGINVVGANNSISIKPRMTSLTLSSDLEAVSSCKGKSSGLVPAIKLCSIYDKCFC